MEQILLLPDEAIGTIHPEFHGQFAEHLGWCVNDGLWVGPDSTIANDGGIRLDVLRALQKLQIPVLRWPGGCFADDYHWEDGVGPPQDRPRRINAWWGHKIEDNAFGTHEFLRLCRLLGAKPYMAGNVGSGTPSEMKQWVEYCNFTGDTTMVRRRAANGQSEPFNIQYWGVGNENWGCGGSMTPEDYASAYKQFATYLQTFTREPCRMPLTLIACGPNGNNLDWTHRFFKKTGMPNADWGLHGFAAHYYCGSAGKATEYSTDQWYELLVRAAAVEKLIIDQRSAMDEYDPQRRIGLILDEWGTWHPPTTEPNVSLWWQQNTLRDALVAAITLDAFNRHADKLIMANIAQVANVLQSMILTQGDRMLLTPTYHVFDMYRSHQAGQSVRVECESRDVRFAIGDTIAAVPALSASASLKPGQITISLVNRHVSLAMETLIRVKGQAQAPVDVDVCTLSHPDITAHNTFAQPELLHPVTERVRFGTDWRLTLPPASVTVLHLSRS